MAASSYPKMATHSCYASIEKGFRKVTFVVNNVNAQKEESISLEMLQGLSYRDIDDLTNQWLRCGSVE